MQNLVGAFAHRPAIITIATNDTMSAAVACTGLILVGIAMPTSYTAGNITLLGSLDGTLFGPLTDEDNGAITFTSPAAGAIALVLPSTPLIGGLTHMKLQTQNSQAANRTFNLIFLAPGAA